MSSMTSRARPIGPRDSADPIDMPDDHPAMSGKSSTNGNGNGTGTGKASASQEQSNLDGDYHNVALLLLLYTLQGACHAMSDTHALPKPSTRTLAHPW